MRKVSEYMFAKYLEPDERIDAIFHRHPIVFVSQCGRILLFGFGVPMFLWYLFPEFALLFAIWLIVSCIRMMRAFYIYYHDALLLTNISLVDVYWHGFFDRSQARLEYPLIEGVNTEIRGFIPTVFNYGKVTVQGGNVPNPISLPDAANPSKVERKIMSYQEQFVSDQSLKDADSLKSLLTTMVRHHAKTHGTPPTQKKKVQS
ncbi:MAG TPA: hypothetical protein VI588_03005 [Candidatus Gracilibacteria bacterium]|nr:hypothetical protein [Candidatus Gracilibacteria bacterium]